MAPKKKHSEGIELLSVYSDEDDEEMEDAEEDDEELRRQEEEDDEHREVVTMEEEKGEDEREASSRTPGAMEGGASEDEEPGGSNRKVLRLQNGEIEGPDISGKNSDVLNTFLPPPPKQKCAKELQEKISKFLGLKEKGKSFNEEVRRRKDYRNPDFLLHAVRYQDIDQIGSCFIKEVFDPHGYDPSDYYEEIEVDMKREREMKEQESKKNQKLDFVSVGTQPGNVPACQKPVIPMPGLPASLSAGLPPISTTADSAARDGKANKKSKWDKVDGDMKNHIPSGTHDSLSSLRANAAILSAANSASGYTAFAQQRRREAEEKRSSMERKLERRS